MWRLRKAAGPAVALALLSATLGAARAGTVDPACDTGRKEPNRASHATACTPVPFDRTLRWQGIAFRVRTANQGSINELRIEPSGLEIDNSPIVVDIDGQVVGAEVADLNRDRSPELYVYVRSAGSGSYGSLVAYGANRRKSLSAITLPPLGDHATAMKGYLGHDEFAIVGNALVRRFPIYKDGDTNAAPSGGVRQLHHRLTAGEAGWVLRLERVVE